MPPFISPAFAPWVPLGPVSFLFPVSALQVLKTELTRPHCPLESPCTYSIFNPIHFFFIYFLIHFFIYFIFLNSLTS